MRHCQFTCSTRIILVGLVLVITMIPMMLLTSCSNTPAATTTTAASTTTVDEKKFTTTDLAAFDGKDGRKAYIAVDGIVYDVTAIAAWGSKLHAGKFQAGKDYTEELKAAPHGVDKLLTAVKIGVLSD